MSFKFFSERKLAYQQRFMRRPFSSPSHSLAIYNRIHPSTAGFIAMRNTLSKIPCSFCPESFFGKHELTVHLSLKHGHELPYVCTLCGKGYQTRLGLNFHMQAHEGKTFPCPICDARLSQKGLVKRHLNAVHKKDKCTICLQIFSIGPEFNLHVLHCTNQRIM